MEFLAEFHPKVVHFPIALLSVYVLVEIISAITKNKFFSYLAYSLLVLGVVGAIAAVLTGEQAGVKASIWDEIGTKNDAIIPFGLISEHEEYATITVWFFFALLVLRTLFVIQFMIRKNYEKFLTLARYCFALLAIIGSYYIYQTAEHGGKLVYKYGVGTELIKPENIDSLSNEKSIPQQDENIAE